MKSFDSRGLIPKIELPRAMRTALALPIGTGTFI